MISTLRSIQRIRGSSGANRLIYYFKKLPVLGKLLKGDIYSNIALKQVFAGIVLALKVVWGFLGKFAYLGIVIYLPIVLTHKELPHAEQYALFLHIFIVLSFIVAAVSNVFILEPKRDKYICVKLMRIPAKQYMHATLLIKGLTFFIYYVPALTVFAGIFGAPLWHGVWLTLLLTAWRIVTEALNLWFFDKKEIVLVKKMSWVWSVIGLGGLLAYVPLYLGYAFVNDATGFSVPVSLVIVVLGGIAAVYIGKYPNYRSAVDVVTKIDDPLLDMNRMMKEARVADVQTKEKDFSSEELMGKAFQGKTGYAYLNAIFFSRHKRLLIQPIQRRLTIICVLFIVAVLMMLISPETSSKFTAYLLGGLPFFVFIMNYTSIGERVCKAMFYNCDLSLLRYGFYREQTAILDNFKIRLIKLSGLNLIPAVAICLACTLLFLLSGADWGLMDAVIFWVTILCLSLFFSVHHLFMYYIFQPYSTELNMKNPFFFIVNSIVLGLSVACIGFPKASSLFTLVVLAGTIAYMVIAVTLVYKFSSRTFRVK
ncbi:hypothetical protein NSQ90_07925 [Paenibacillus sp. FSL H7-0737]|uniref:hypothetical protein n=1 Tax=Paenibacillus sp. FSL H7-0737 TaxID=1536775 RepID=UPI0004F7DB73|nr:hypothetical protein [Paenibacillus sp. FSL H7-0737]AIQ22803.1 hypothetical protein H70737_08020 [Paenibacillus sp. FSL H7-0737]